MIESAARRLAHELVNRREAINRELSRNGVRFGIYKNGEYHDRLFPYDPVPRIIESDEYDELEKGLKQRVNALNAYLKDIYSDKAIIHDGVVPEEYVYTSAGYFPAGQRRDPSRRHFRAYRRRGPGPRRGRTMVGAGRQPAYSLGCQLPAVRARHRAPHLPAPVPRRSIRDNREYPRLLRKAMDFVSTEASPWY